MTDSKILFAHAQLDGQPTLDQLYEHRYDFKCKKGNNRTNYDLEGK